MVVKRWHLARRRVILGMSRERLAELLEVEYSTISRWEDGNSTPRPWVRPRLAELLRVSVEQLDDLLSGIPIAAGSGQSGGSEPDISPRMMVTNWPQAGQPPWEIPEPTSTTIDPEDLERQVFMSTEDAARFRDRMDDVGDLTIEFLQAETRRLARLTNTAGPLERFGSVRLLRDRLLTYLERGHSATRRRELAFLGGAACGMLAEAVQGLGYTSAALTDTRVGLFLADEAGSDDLRAWFLGVRSIHYYWAGQPKRARELAHQGRQLATTGAVSAFLPAMEARACGALGNTEGVAEALQEAADAREHLTFGNLDDYGGNLSFSTGWQYFCAAKALLDLGDGRAVIPHAAAAVATYESGPEDELNLDIMAQSHAGAATAHVINGDLDAAKEDTQAAFDIPAERRVASLDDMLKEMNRELRRPNVRDSRTAIELRDQIEDFLAVTPTRPAIE